MPQIFHRSTNTISRVTLVAALLAVALSGYLFLTLARSPWVTRQEEIPVQPVPFSHDHHVGAIGIDCRYCHTGAERSAFAGIPPTATCMNCHAQIWNQAPMLEPVRESFRSGKPLQWTRVHDLPGFAYFNHSIHVAKGIGCETCHGRVDKMPLMWQDSPLTMEWCLACHRDPVPNLRPREDVTKMGWQAPENLPALERELSETYHVPDVAALQRLLAERYRVQSKLSCSTCHR